MLTAQAPPLGDVSIDVVLAERLVRPLFQPIVDLSARTVVGLEALARGPRGTALEFPDRLFAAARAAGRLGELDMLCTERALEEGSLGPEMPPLLFVNAEPEVMNQPLSQRLLDMINKGLPYRYIIEFTERALATVPAALLNISGQAQQWGIGLALDDVGVDPMSLAFLPVLEPEVIKLDMSLVRDPDSDHTRAVCAMVRAEAERTGARVIAEGVETEEDARTARRLGAHWGQGWHFGRPAPIDAVTHRFDPVAATALRTPRPGFHRPTESAFAIAVRQAAPVRATSAEVDAALTELRNRAANSRSVMVSDMTAGSGEFAAAVLAPGAGYAVCGRRTGDDVTELVTLDHLPAVAAVGRALLSRQR